MHEPEPLKWGPETVAKRPQVVEDQVVPKNEDEHEANWTYAENNMAQMMRIDPRNVPAKAVKAPIRMIFQCSLS